MAEQTLHSLAMGSRFGRLVLVADAAALRSLAWDDETEAPEAPATPLLAEARRQVAAYCDGTLERFDLPLAPAGTAFQRRVWDLMRAIPFGRTRTYGAMAADLGSVARAVGGACGANPIPIVIPCHRVLGGGGKAVGFSGGDGVETKRALLAHEGAALV